MKRFVYFLLACSFLITLTNCSDKNSLILGYTPAYLPITLSLDGNGPHIFFNGRIITPIGCFSLSYNLETNRNLNKHVTYIEIINRHEGTKHVIELDDVGESVEWDSSNSHITVKNLYQSTIVTVESDKISNFLHKEKGPGYKPEFPESPIRYFVVFKALNSNINWEIESGADFFADVLFAILAFFAIIIDLFIIIVLFIFRTIWWLFRLLGYLLGI